MKAGVRFKEAVRRPEIVLLVNPAVLLVTFLLETQCGFPLDSEKHRSGWDADIHLIHSLPLGYFDLD